MIIVFHLSWQAVEGAVSYLLQTLDDDGLTTTLTSTTDLEYDVEIDEDLDYAFLVRAYDGLHYGPPRTIIYEKPLTLVSLRTELRTDLYDANIGAYKWSDAELSKYLREAIREYGKLFPAHAEASLTTVLNERAYALPSGCRRVKRVKYTNDSGTELWLKVLPYKGGESSAGKNSTWWKLGIDAVSSASSRAYVGHYEVVANELRIDFDPKDGESLYVEYASEFAPLVHDYVRLEIPREDLEIVALYAKWKAALRVEGQDANLSRWTVEQRRDDNPIIPWSTRFYNAYKQKVEEKQNKPHFRRLTRVT